MKKKQMFFFPTHINLDWEMLYLNKKLCSPSSFFKFSENQNNSNLQKWSFDFLQMEISKSSWCLLYACPSGQHFHVKILIVIDIPILICHYKAVCLLNQAVTKQTMKINKLRLQLNLLLVYSHRGHQSMLVVIAPRYDLFAGWP
jgi:hypothetical protein